MMHQVKTPLLLGLLVLLAGAAAPAQRPFEMDLPVQEGEGARLLRVAHQAMGAEFEFLFYPPDPAMMPEEAAYLSRDAMAAIERLEQRISTWRADSETSRVNRTALDAPAAVGPELLRLLIESKELHGATQGAFDVTVGPLLELWGFYRKEGHVPDKQEIAETLEKVGLEHVRVDTQGETVRLTRPGMRLDFGGIGKGLAVDWAVQVLKQKGVTSGVLHAGTSTVVAMGTPPGQKGWTVRIRSPYNAGTEYLDEVSIKNESLSTSSGSERYFEIGGKRYGHIFDPRTGWPVEGVLSATAIAPTGMQSDGLSTAFFVLGEKGTRAYCEAHPEIRAILVVESPEGPGVVRINFDDDREESS